MQKFKKMGFIAKGNKSFIFTFVHIPLLISTGKLINEMKGRVMVLNIANLTKPLFQVVLWTFYFSNTGIFGTKLFFSERLYL